MKEYFISIPNTGLACGYNVIRFFREEDAQARLSEPGAEQIDKETALKRAGGKWDNITSHYLGVHEQNSPITVSGAWYVEDLPDKIIAEVGDGKLISFQIDPYRKIKKDDISDYAGPHPRRQHGVPMPAVLYPYYGLEKSEESLSEVLRVRLSPSELERIKAAADVDGKTVSEFAREWIRSL